MVKQTWPKIVQFETFKKLLRLKSQWQSIGQPYFIGKEYSEVQKVGKLLRNLFSMFDKMFFTINYQTILSNGLPFRV